MQGLLSFRLPVAIASFGLLSLPAKSSAEIPEGALQPNGFTSKAIQEAINNLPKSGGTVYLPPGVYTATETIVLDRDNVTLTGNGPETMLRLADGANVPLLVMGSLDTLEVLTPSGETKHVTPFITKNAKVSDLSLDANAENQTIELKGGDTDSPDVVRNNALTIRGTWDCSAERLTITSGRSGGVVIEKHTRRFHIKNVKSSKNYFDGFAAYESEGCVLEGCNAFDNGAAGFSFDLHFHRNSIVESKASGNRYQGVFMRHSVGNNFSRCTFTGNGIQQVFIASTEYPQTDSRDNIFSETIIAGPGEHFQVNDSGCTGNSLNGKIIIPQKKDAPAVALRDS